ncbi:hypothetical protein N7466_005776 [Penicillium verhagenii]|uniref:uncharacterized protein n=1 Tax=Penicillium verhagenii TaxID=1562060 RepID=UPI002544EEBA|nr:uncharacterized protein N7466_005776 [Penicillium verhagenii]KAJ5930283.1 hypothetical protein N7466_005776 [Penicillium verhagenii]
MLSLRAFSRSIPRFSRSIARTSMRPAVLPKPTMLQPWKQVSKPAYAAFSTSSAFREPAAEGDVELLAKLDEEVKHEKASGAEDAKEQKASIDYTLQAGEWTVKDVAGEQEVVLSKKFGNESIRVTFTVADINNLSEDPMDELHDDALGDETDYQQNGRDIENDDILPPTFPARLDIAIEKANNGALLIQAVIQDSELQIEEISHFKDAEIANAHSAEKDWTRQSLYSGPPAENLDPELIAFWGRYLEERGLNVEFQNMITDYIAFKEQKEYVSWLENVRKFIAA